jgi:putative SOS response-associated peptidase YedK
MCGRYAVKLLAEVLELPFVEEAAFPELELPWVHYNVCPGMQAPMVDNRGVLRLALWGLIPHWSQHKPPGRPLVNARLETAATRASFRTAWSSQRCAIPVSGFYEWSDLCGERWPYFVPSRHGELLWLAGLASHLDQPDQGGRRWTFTVLTESSENSVVQPLHDRVPVVLRAEAVPDWLGGQSHPPAGRAALEPPYRVSKRVNAASVNTPDNLRPWEDAN